MLAINTSVAYFFSDLEYTMTECKLLNPVHKINLFAGKKDILNKNFIICLR